MTICCNDNSEQKLYDTPPIIVEPFNSNCSIKIGDQIIVPVNGCHPTKNDSKRSKQNSTFIILLIIYIFFNIDKMIYIYVHYKINRFCHDYQQ